MTTATSTTAAVRSTAKESHADVRLVPSLVVAGLLLPLGLGLNYLLNVSIARMLPVGGYGMFSFALSLASTATVAAACGFSQSLLRFVPKYASARQYEQLHGFLRSSLLIVLLGSLAAGGLIVTYAYGAAPADTRWALLWAAALLPGLGLDVWREGALRGIHRTTEAILPRYLALPLVALALVHLIRPSTTTAVMTLYIVTFYVAELTALAGALRRFAPSAVRTPTYDIRNWLRTSLPMGLSSLAHLGMRQWDIVVLGLLSGLENAGTYSAAARTALLTALVLRVINLVVGPMLAELYHGGRLHEFRRLLGLSTLGATVAGLPVCGALVLFPDTILGLFGASYEAASTSLRILAVGQFVNLATGPVGLALTMSEHEKPYFYLSLGGSVVSLFALLTLVPSYGPEGAAWATTLGLSTINLGAAVLVVRYLTAVEKAEQCVARERPMKEEPRR